MEKSLYQILGVSQKASRSMIHEAYGRLRGEGLSRRQEGYPDATNELVALASAYEILGNSEKRSAYDDHLAARLYQPSAPATTRTLTPIARPTLSPAIDGAPDNQKLASCRACNGSVAINAPTCPRCGELNPALAKPKANAGYGLLLLGIPVFATALLWFYVPRMTLIQSPGSAVQLILLGVVVVTALVVAMEASNFAAESSRQKTGLGSVGWFIFMMLFWFVAYPLYLYKRVHIGLVNHFVLGLLVALAFIASALVMNSAIDTKLNEVRGALKATPANTKLPGAAPTALESIYRSVAADAEQQYYMTKRSGTLIDVCVHAGIVASSYLQAKDESSYRIWKQTENIDCARAGLPR